MIDQTLSVERSRGHWLCWLFLAVGLLAVAGALFALPLRHCIEVLLQATQSLIPGTLLYVYLGSTAKDLAQVFSGNVEAGMAQQLIKILGLVATVVVTIIITRIARRSLREAVPQTDNKENLQ